MRAVFQFVAVLALMYGAALAEPVHIDAQGSGPTRQSAVSGALISAIQQATGVTIDATQFSGMISASVATDTTHDTLMVRATQEAISRVARGTIHSYRIASIAAAPDGGFVAEVGVDIEVFRAKGLGNEKRRRIAVADFDGSGNQGLEAALRDSLLANLTQTRRFAVVDRSNDRAYESEMALITGPNANPAERARAGQVLGADYVVTGHLMVEAARTVGRAAQATSRALELNGEVVTNTTPSTLRVLPGSLSTSFEVIEIATRQIKFAARIDLPGQDLDALAQAIASRITNAIYPPRLVDIDDPQAVIINQGGSALNTGQRFRVMQEGRELFDPYSGESLGEKEVPIAVIEVIGVGDKVSRAKVVLGNLSGVAAALVLRSVEAEVPGPELRPPPAPRHRAAIRSGAAAPPPSQHDTGVRLPFDQ